MRRTGKRGSRWGTRKSKRVATQSSSVSSSYAPTPLAKRTPAEPRSAPRRRLATKRTRRRASATRVTRRAANTPEVFPNELCIPFMTKTMVGDMRGRVVDDAPFGPEIMEEVLNIITTNYIDSRLVHVSMSEELVTHAASGKGCIIFAQHNSDFDPMYILAALPSYAANMRKVCIPEPTMTKDADAAWLYKKLGMLCGPHLFEEAETHIQRGGVLLLHPNTNGELHTGLVALAKRTGCHFFPANVTHKTRGAVDVVFGDAFVGTRIPDIVIEEYETDVPKERRVSRAIAVKLAELAGTLVRVAPPRRAITSTKTPKRRLTRVRRTKRRR